MNSRRIKDRACELAEGYEEAKDEAFNEEFLDFRLSMEEGELFTEDLLQGFLDSFSFPEEGDWAMDKALSELDDIGDQKMEEARDREMGL